jgi:hypothetical protein
LILLTILLLIAAGTLVGGSGLRSASTPATALEPAAGSVDSFEERLELLGAAIESGNEYRTEELQESLSEFIRADLAQSAQRVRDLARDITLQGAELPDSTQSAETLTTEDKLALSRAQFCHFLEFLNAKETVYRDLRDQYDLKHRYRLLGDYLNLLRKELNMPRLRLASAPSQTRGRVGFDDQNDAK